MTDNTTRPPVLTPRQKAARGGLHALAANRLEKAIILLKNTANTDNHAPNTPNTCLLYTSPSPRDRQKSRMPSSA